jgi:hypothetical protein
MNYAIDHQLTLVTQECPCCNRTFQQLARHMKAKHPEHAS